MKLTKSNIQDIKIWSQDVMSFASLYNLHYTTQATTKLVILYHSLAQRRASILTLCADLNDIEGYHKAEKVFSCYSLKIINNDHVEVVCDDIQYVNNLRGVSTFK